MKRVHGVDTQFSLAYASGFLFLASLETNNQQKSNTMEDLYLGKTNYKVLGQRPVRHDGADKVTGKAIYTADLQLPNMAHARMVRSPHAHAKIKRID